MLCRGTKSHELGNCMGVSMDDEGLRVRILRQTTYHLINLGFQARQRGYRYLREAVWIAYKDPATLAAVTKRLYPAVAKYFDTSDKQVERAIRNAIETAWLKGEPQKIKDFFGESHKDGTLRPTNTEVIKKLVGILKNGSNGGDI